MRLVLRQIPKPTTVNVYTIGAQCKSNPQNPQRKPAQVGEAGPGRPHPTWAVSGGEPERVLMGNRKPVLARLGESLGKLAEGDSSGVWRERWKAKAGCVPEANNSGTFVAKADNESAYEFLLCCLRSGVSVGTVSEKSGIRQYRPKNRQRLLLCRRIPA